MKLVTPYGQLDLPRDFAMTMERTNPLLSDQGDSSIPTTLPASPHNLAVLGHRERIDRANRYTNKVDAILEAGPVQKQGHLIIDTAQRQKGIDVSFAIDNSDLYSKSKKKKLPEILERISQTFQSVEAAVIYMEHVYGGDSPTEDYNVFPVAVSKYEDDNGNTIYQYNNEVIGNGSLNYEARTVREDDILMAVPEGYGIAPFLKLHRLIDLLFEQLGYTVTYNCFSANNYKDLTIVHNCSDCLVRPVLNYSDLVPTCTLHDFITWINAKFHAQPIVNSDSKEVKIVFVESVLASAADADISSKVEGEPRITLSPSSRIVLTPTNTIEGTEPPMRTLDQLNEKYGGYIRMDETMFESLNGDNAPFVGRLMLRNSTGMFYEQCLKLTTAKPILNPIGTNHFTYDRDNSEQTEEITQSDVMPLMICQDKLGVAPYIGTRTHRHTAFRDKDEDGNQDIIVVRAFTSISTRYRTTGTTQERIPNSDYTESSFYYDLTNYGLYNWFWANYNEILLNNKTMVNVKLDAGIQGFFKFDTATLKMMKGQKLLPEKISLRMGTKAQLAEADFVLIQDFVDLIHDDNIGPDQLSGFSWEVTKYEEEAAQACVGPLNVVRTYVAYYPNNGGIIYTGPPIDEYDERLITVIGNLMVVYEDYAGQQHSTTQLFEDVPIQIRLRAQG